MTVVLTRHNSRCTSKNIESTTKCPVSRTAHKVLEWIRNVFLSLLKCIQNLLRVISCKEPTTTRNATTSPSDRSRRPPLVEDPSGTLEERLRINPEDTLNELKQRYGKVFRYTNQNTAKSTVCICDNDIANAALKSRSISFDIPSYQSKTRFGLHNYMKLGPMQAAKLSTYFRKNLNDQRNLHLFQTRFKQAMKHRIESFVQEQQVDASAAAETTATVMPLTDIVAKIVFAANVDTIFGNQVYTLQFYNDFQIFSKSIGYRSASSKAAATTQDVESEQAKIVHQAKQRLLKILSSVRRTPTQQKQSRESSPEAVEALPIIQNIQTTLHMTDEEADLLSLLLLWGANVNLLPSSIWIISRMLLQQESTTSARGNNDFIASLTQEKQKQTVSEDGNENDRRPMLDSVIAEGLRLYSRPNMYRVATKDCTIRVNEDTANVASHQLSQHCDKQEIEIQKDEWIWLFPKSYLHYNNNVYPEPEMYKPFERWLSDDDTKADRYTCPFKNGFKFLRVFGGGYNPCPGKEYAIMVLRMVVDQLVLTSPGDGREGCNFKITKLAARTSRAGKIPSSVDGRVSPKQVTQSVASTPPPSDDIYVEVVCV